jgi:hypothetical protein
MNPAPSFSVFLFAIQQKMKADSWVCDLTIILENGWESQTVRGRPSFHLKPGCFVYVRVPVTVIHLWDPRMYVRVLPRSASLDKLNASRFSHLRPSQSKISCCGLSNWLLIPDTSLVSKHCSNSSLYRRLRPLSKREKCPLLQWRRVPLLKVGCDEMEWNERESCLLQSLAVVPST